MKSNWKDWALCIIILASIGFILYSACNIVDSPEADKWLARPFAGATMKDVLGIGGLLVALHAILTR